MKLFYWTEDEYDTCSHYAVFAEDEEEARTLVIQYIHEIWGPGENETDPEWLKNRIQKDVESFTTSWKWKLAVYEIKPGVLEP